MKVWYYHIYEAKGKKLIAEGTSAQLVEQGLFKSPKDLGSRYAKFLKSSHPRVLFERSMVDKPRRKQTAVTSYYVERREMLVYTCYDAAGKKMGHGTARELVEQGIFGCECTVHDTYRRYGGVNQRRGVARMEAEKRLRKVRSLRPGRRKPTGTRPAVPDLRNWVEHPSALMLDVRDLMNYNYEARKAGRPELSYGPWSAKGKPLHP